MNINKKPLGKRLTFDDIVYLNDDDVILCPDDQIELAENAVAHTITSLLNEAFNLERQAEYAANVANAMEFYRKSQDALDAAQHIIDCETRELYSNV